MLFAMAHPRTTPAPTPKPKPKPDDAERRESRAPQQERSRARVQKITAAADRILATEGSDALTIRHLAEVAEVPVGTIYQFFADKNAVVDVIARSYLERFEAVMTELVLRAEQTPFVDLVDGVLDAFIEMYRSNPGYLAIW